MLDGLVDGLLDVLDLLVVDLRLLHAVAADGWVEVSLGSVVSVVGGGSSNVVLLDGLGDGEVTLGTGKLVVKGGSVEVLLWGDELLLDLRAGVMEVWALGVALSALEGDLGGVEGELRSKALNFGSLEGVSDVGTTGGESSSGGSSGKHWVVNSEAGLRSLNTEAGARSINAVLNAGASVRVGADGDFLGEDLARVIDGSGVSVFDSGSPHRVRGAVATIADAATEATEAFVEVDATNASVDVEGTDAAADTTNS